jgi:uncharacterized protein
LAFEPSTAIQQAKEAVQALQQQKGIEQVFVIGSSLGGFYATSLGEQENVTAVLINPAVRPYELFDKYLGPNEHFYDGQTYILEMKHIEQLKALEIMKISNPDNMFLLLQTGDETLDFSLASGKYINCPSWIEAGGNHSFEGFMDRLDMVFHFVSQKGLA